MQEQKCKVVKKKTTFIAMKAFSTRKSKVVLGMVVLCVVIIVVALVAVFVHKKQLFTNFAKQPALLDDEAQPTMHVNMTTIPERFASDWFAANMRRMLTTMRGNYVWWCNIPPVFESTQEPYVVSTKVQALLEEFPNFRLFHTKKDYGPITKVLGPLQNPEIPSSSALLICDDDIQYLPDFVRIAAAHFANNANRVYTFCGKGVTGYQGFVLKKQLCERIPNNIPFTCRRIDDDLLDLHFEQYITAISYNNDTSKMCTIDASDWGDWHTEHRTALRDDNRQPMVKACQRDFKRNKNAQRT